MLPIAKGDVNVKRYFAPLSACSALALSLFVAGCSNDSKNPNAGKRPSEALAATVEAAKTGNLEAFRQGLSANFVATIERYQQLGAAKEELTGAFDWPVFMRSLAMTDPAPREELVQGNKAKVRAVHKDGTEGVTDMVLEDGMWKLEVPPGMVTGLDHFDDIAKMAAGEPVELKPDIKLGGGGTADRLKKLPADAPESERQKAAALDAFDLGNLSSAPQLLEEALKANPDDEELIVALGRAFVQTGRGADAVKLFEGYLTKDEKSVPVRHYLGMAYMLTDEPKKAASEWQRVMELDAVYGSRFRLDQRAAAALAIAEGGGGAPGHGDITMPPAGSMHGGGQMPPSPHGGAGHGTAPMPSPHGN